MAKEPQLIFRDDGTIRIDHVRLSYPHLFTAWGDGGLDDQGKPKKKKFSMKGLIDVKTRRPQIVQLRNHIIKFAADSDKGIKLPADRLCLKDGSGSGKPEQEGHWILSASEDTRPQVVDRKGNPVAEEDGIVYGGCYVNVLIRLWYQSNKFGKRVNANLLTVQFNEDGEAFSESGPRPDAKDVFDADEEEGGLDGGGLDDDDIAF